MPVVNCPEIDCQFDTGDVNDAAGAVLLKYHLDRIHPAPAMSKPLVFPLPKLKGGVTEDEFKTFEQEWEVFKKSSYVPKAQTTAYLLNTCDQDLRACVVKEDDKILEKTAVEIVRAIKRLAVVNVATSVLQTELLGLTQQPDEPVRHFAARARGKAANCKLTHVCSREPVLPGGTRCDQVNSYAEDVVKMVVLFGMCDEDIKREVLGTDDLVSKDLNTTIALIETKETATRSLWSNDLSTAQHSAMTSYQKVQADDKRLKVKGKCKKCKEDFLKNARFRGKNGEFKLKTYKICKKCFEEEKTSKKKDKEDTENTAGAFTMFAVEFNLMFEKAEKEARTKHWADKKAKKKERQRERRASALPASLCDDEFVAEVSEVQGGIKIPNFVFDGRDGWKMARPEAHPTIRLTITTAESDYAHLKLRHPVMRTVERDVVTDTGAQCNLLGLKMFQSLGLRRRDVVSVVNSMRAVNGEGINILGAVFLRLSAKDHNLGRLVETGIMAYVTDSTEKFFLSRQAMVQMGMIPTNFPTVSAENCSADGQQEEKKKAEPDKQHCGCPVRKKPPMRPNKLPFSPIPENIPKIKRWLIERFNSSTLNKCPHEKLPMMNSEPGVIHVDPEAEPTCVKTASSVPIHWRNEVKEQLEEDLALGVIERVPVGTPTEWQARMVVTPKADGSPRRTVDLSGLNRSCRRETQHVVPPYKQARLVEGGSGKTIFDAWNGFHSVPLHRDCRDLTTLITEDGRFRYCVMPQGFCAAGDGYNQRYDMIISGIGRLQKCVDDVVLWDKSLEAHWWRVIDFLELVGRQGIAINPEKFQFCEKEVKFAGFHITEDSVKPLKKYLDAIMAFPTPTNVSDIRSWFGLVNQVSRYARLTCMMEPFKPFLSPRTRFEWTEEMEHLFKQSKVEIVNAIKEGVQIFNPERTTLLSPDWSKIGIGYILYQKHCSCHSRTTECCVDGWKIVAAGSRFTQKSEKNYWPVEGESLALKWALEDTKFFTWGCLDLIVQTDHRPLLKIFGDRSFEDIPNLRILSFKEKAMAWRFEIVHVPGKNIPGPDALSRNPENRGIQTFTSDSDKDAVDVDLLKTPWTWTCWLPCV